ncbi:MAG: twin-arginine translocase TatA/TatE family subunit [Gammaproteobacteria bacterium]|nr:twin-arginine translocase TatA/TatE family subunit [Gammaproteobacteria bacterium]
MIGSPTQLIIILAIVLVLFGAKKLRNIGGDIGTAIKNFRSSVRDGSEEAKAAEDTAAPGEKPAEQNTEGRVIEAEVVKEKDKVS